MQVQVERLDASLSRCGENVIVRRYKKDGSNQDFTVRGMVRPLSGPEVRPGAANTQLTMRIILSPTGLETILPLKTTDKVVRGGQERQIGWVDNKSIGDDFIRITADISG